MKKELILFYYPNKHFFINKKEIKKFKKKYSKVILYNKFDKYKSLNFDYKNKKLNNIKFDYKKIGIDIDLKKIYEINSFLKNIKFKNKKIFVSPYFINGKILEEEFIFYELSKIYKIQFVRPELSFLKNRFILAKNFFKQPYVLKKKTYFTKKNYDKFKNNYISSIQFFSDLNFKTKLNTHISKMFIYILNFFINLRFNNKPKKYILVILNNNKYLNLLSNNINLKYLVNKILSKFNYELVFLIHPQSSPFKLFLKLLKNKNFFFKNKRIIFLQKPKKLLKIIQSSKFIIHLSSSLSAQALFLNKKILCAGKNYIYIKNLNNIVSKIDENNFDYLEKVMNKNDTSEINKFLINLLSMSVNSKGEFKLSIKKKDYIYNSRPKIINKYDKDIIQSLLNAI